MATNCRVLHNSVFVKIFLKDLFSLILNGMPIDP